MENKFGLYLHSLRKKHYLTQGELADLLNVSHQAVSNWERGLSIPDVQLILPLTKILDTTAERLLYMMCGEYHNKSIEAYLLKKKQERED